MSYLSRCLKLKERHEKRRTMAIKNVKRIDHHTGGLEKMRKMLYNNNG